MGTSIEFADTDEFYARLKELLEEREQITITTSLERYDAVPKRLRDIFELERSRAALTSASGAFALGVTANAGVHMNTLYVASGAAAGAAIGAAVGGIPTGGVGAGPGALVGGVVGGGLGVLAAATTQGKFTAEVIIEKNGRLTIRVKPK